MKIFEKCGVQENMYESDSDYEDPNDISTWKVEHIPEFEDDQEIETSPKSIIPEYVRVATWKKWAQCKREIDCWVNCGSKISFHHFHCGHVLAEAKGGRVDVRNLRPICKYCNSSMGTQHMFDFIVNHGFRDIPGYALTEKKLYSQATNAPEAVKRRVWHDIAQKIDPETGKPRNAIYTQCSVASCPNQVYINKTKYAFDKFVGECTVANVKPVCKKCHTQMGVYTVKDYDTFLSVMRERNAYSLKRPRPLEKFKPKKRQKI